MYRQTTKIIQNPGFRGEIELRRSSGSVVDQFPNFVLDSTLLPRVPGSRKSPENEFLEPSSNVDQRDFDLEQKEKHCARVRMNIENRSKSFDSCIPGRYTVNQREIDRKLMKIHRKRL